MNKTGNEINKLGMRDEHIELLQRMNNIQKQEIDDLKNQLIFWKKKYEMVQKELDGSV